MQLLFHTPLDNRIAQLLLSRGEEEIEALYQLLLAQGNPMTLQGLYKSLRRLIQDGIVIKNKQSVAINSEWNEGMLELLQQASRPLQLADGESLTYSFKRLSSLDAQWKHVMAPLEKNFSSYPVFLYNPYEIWIQLADRRESEIRYYTRFEGEGRYCFCLLGAMNRHNESFKKDYQNNFLQISVGNEIVSNRNHIAIISDYIITTILPPAMARTITAIYNIEDQRIISEKIGALFSKSTSLKLKIERNETKAERLRKKIAKDFYIPKELKKKYNLY